MTMIITVSYFLDILEKRNLTEQEIAGVAKDILAALEYLHHQNIVHR